MELVNKSVGSCFKVLGLSGILMGGLCAQTSSLVYPGGPDGKLVYKGYANEGQTYTDNKMIDYSGIGYMNGNEAIPFVPVVMTLDPDPSGGDDYARIQAAIDAVSAMPLSAAGFRGALLLKAGDYRSSKTIFIKHDGVVLRGEGQGEDGTTITYTNNTSWGGGGKYFDEAVLLRFWSAGDPINDSTHQTAIIDDVVPSGAHSFRVADASEYSVGESIRINRSMNDDWITVMGMAQFGWSPGYYSVPWTRKITAIDGNLITVDVPMANPIETQYGGGSINHFDQSPLCERSGVENIRLESVYAGNSDENHGWTAIYFTRSVNCWARRVTAKHFAYATILTRYSRNITGEDCAFLAPKSKVSGGRRYAFAVDDAEMILYQRCLAKQGRHSFVAKSGSLGPTAWVDCLAEEDSTDIGPHARYSHGLLFDNVKGKQINVQNRLDSGSGHGWAGAQVTFWNCHSRTSIACDAPPSAMNFCIGCVGTKVEGRRAADPFGIWESHETPVIPRSLYYQQLSDRAGKERLYEQSVPKQRSGRIWDDLSSWNGNSAPPWLPPFAPVQVVTDETMETVVDEPTALIASIIYKLPSNFPTHSASWSVVSGPGTPAFSDVTSAVTDITFDVPGTYELKYEMSQDDNSDPNNIVTYSGSDTITVTVAENSSHQWMDSEYSIPDPDETDWNADQDDDGVISLLEYALGGGASTADREILPVLEQDTAGVMSFVFNRRQQGIAPEHYVVEYTSSLTSGIWTPFPPPISTDVTAHPSLPGFDQVRITVPSVEERMFVRLGVAN